MSVASVLDEIAEEREQQKLKAHGGDTDAYDLENTESDWVAIICAYIGRASNRNQVLDFRTCMVKVGALAIAAIEAHDRKSKT